MPIKSEREDKRGHWPKGKPRNETRQDWPKLRKKLERLLASPARKTPIEEEFVRSRSGLSRWLGVHEKTVRRWLSGEDSPAAETVDRIEQWIAHWS